ncbi:MAG: hypothetical protein A2051_10285 [Desulfovibrionales bacterium GWA2_65_9]|nr:MAG: hypothetical protein A2051_10285 [Desulfovibrionales bacterium GWA2_65_9]
MQDEVDTKAFRHCGVDFWPLVRMRICQLVYCHRVNLPIVEATAGGAGRRVYAGLPLPAKAWLFLKRLAHRALCARRQARLLRQMRSQAPVDVLFLSREQYHSEIMDGAWYDRCVDPFVELAQGRFRHLKVEVTEEPRRTPRRHKTIFIDPNDARYKAGARLSSPRQPTAAFLKGLSTAARVLADAGIHGGLEAHGLLCQVEEVLLYRDLLAEVLKAARPKAVFFTCIVDLVSMGAVAACKQLGITSVEIHHGYAGNNHSLYTHHRSVPPQGFQLLPDLSWMWSEDSAKAFGSWYPPDSPHQFLAGGNLWLAKWVGQNPLPTPQEHAHFLDSLPKGKRVVLFSDGWGEPIVQQFPETLIETMRQSQSDCIWLIRLHPNYREKEEEISKLLRANGVNTFEISHSTQCPLPALLRITDHHVTRFSSVFFEAKQFGLHTTMIAEMAEVYFTEYQADPMLHFCRDPKEIARNVRTCPREEQAASLLVRPPGEVLALFTRIVTGKMTRH